MAGDPKASDFYPADNPAAIAHINLLQGIINRLANNSASCKTWCLSILAALLSLAGATHNPTLVTIALVPVTVFGFIDTMYLANETAYRDLYKRIVGAIRDGEYRLANTFEAGAWNGVGHFLYCFIRAAASWAIWPVYLGLVAAYVAADHWGALDALATVPKPP